MADSRQPNKDRAKEEGCDDVRRRAVLNPDSPPRSSRYTSIPSPFRPLSGKSCDSMPACDFPPPTPEEPPVHYHGKPLPPVQLEVRPREADSQRFQPPAVVFEVIAILAPFLEHIPYAVCGLAAMLAYGFDGRAPTHVSILTTAESLGAVKGWCLANPHEVVGVEGRSDAVNVRTADGILRRVYIKSCSSNFQHVSRVRLRINGVKTWVLTLAGVTDNYARMWAHSAVGAVTCRRKIRVAADLFWLLHRIIDDPTGLHRLWNEEGRGAAVLAPLFWEVFTVAYPGSAGLFVQAGIPAPVEG